MVYACPMGGYGAGFGALGGFSLLSILNILFIVIITGGMIWMIIQQSKKHGSK